jgi:DNA-binding NarL/FixJ family response regulator
MMGIRSQNPPPCAVIVDDDDPRRQELRRALEGGGIVVAGTREAFEAPPGPIVMLVAVAKVERVPVYDLDARVLLLADGDAELGLADAVAMGAHGFVRRTAPTRDLVDAVRAAADGRGLTTPKAGRVQAAVAQAGSMSSFSATAGDPSAR